MRERALHIIDITISDTNSTLKGVKESLDKARDAVKRKDFEVATMHLMSAVLEQQVAHSINVSAALMVFRDAIATGMIVVEPGK